MYTVKVETKTTKYTKNNLLMTSFKIGISSLTGTVKQHNNSSISPNKLIAKITSYIFVSTVTILSFLKYIIHKSNV